MGHNGHDYQIRAYMSKLIFGLSQTANAILTYFYNNTIDRQLKNFNMGIQDVGDFEELRALVENYID